MPKITVNDIAIYYEIHGEGQPLLLIAGLGTDLTLYEPITRELSKKYRVIVFDNRGVGRTDKPDIPYSIERMAGDTAGLLEALHLDSVHVLGISMGGRIAMALTLQYPRLVKSLVLTSTAASLRNSRSLLRMKLLGLIPLRRLRKYPQPYYAYKRQLIASRSYDCTGRLGEIGVPALILCGTRDKLVSRAMAEELNSGIRGSKMITFDGGHMFFMFRQEAYVSAILEFLATV